jgi:putative transposase
LLLDRVTLRCLSTVKTLKRDYARCTILPDAESAFRLIPEWIEDYNESYAHSGLRFLSPREFRQRAECA